MNAPTHRTHFTRAITEQVLNRAYHAAGMPYRCYGCDGYREDEVTDCPACGEVTSSYVMERGQ